MYETGEDLTLPQIPGYDLDINENLKGDDDDRYMCRSFALYKPATTPTQVTCILL